MAPRPATLALALCASLSLTCARVSIPRGHAVATPPQVTGQWIWTRADADIFERTHTLHPRAQSSVLAATIVDGPNGLELRRGLAPAAGGAGPVAILVRIDDSIHARWDARGASGMASDLGPLLARVLSGARATGAEIAEVELDYDAPERRLAAWASVVATLADHELAGVPLWITSIPAHLDDPEYGARLAGHVQGHILQLFDTDLAWSPAEVERLRTKLETEAIPFRLGVAAFERTKRGRRTTSHGAWLDSIASFKDIPGFAGAWLFPAGREYETRFASLEGNL